MPLDGILLKKLTNEIHQVAKNARVEKIYQPSKEELVFSLRSKQFSGRLLISSKMHTARMNFINDTIENPEKPPMFCMLLRKYLSGAKILSIEQPSLDRVAVMKFEAINEMGDIIQPSLIVEFIGSQPRIILVDSQNKIIDAIKRSDIESSTRLIQPGASYVFPDSSNKLSVLEYEPAEIVDRILIKNTPLWRAILDSCEGISPLVAREIANNICQDFEKPVFELSSKEKDNILSCIENLRNVVLTKDTPILLLDNLKNPVDFCYFPIKQYGDQRICKQVDSFSCLLDEFYSKKDKTERIRAMKSDLLKQTNNIFLRANRKMSARKQDLKNCESREKYRVYGELLKANLNSVPKGACVVHLQNYYSENLETVKIPLDVSISPAANAQKYFKEYKKANIARQTLLELIEQGEKEIEYIESVLEEISRAQTSSEISEIREELQQSGYIYLRKVSKIKKQTPLKPKKFISSEGFNVFVGRNNRQNDELSTKTSEKSDIWFHAKNIPGAHVVISCEGKIPGDKTIEYAAMLAAYHSRAKNSSLVPVDATFIKHVKKPSGAAMGKVIYTNNKTYFVDPTKLNI